MPDWSDLPKLQGGGPKFAPLQDGKDVDVSGDMAAMDQMAAHADQQYSDYMQQAQEYDQQKIEKQLDAIAQQNAAAAGIDLSEIPRDSGLESTLQDITNAILPSPSPDPPPPPPDDSSSSGNSFTPSPFSVSSPSAFGGMGSSSATAANSSTSFVDSFNPFSNGTFFTSGNSSTATGNSSDSPFALPSFSELESNAVTNLFDGKQSNSSDNSQSPYAVNEIIEVNANATDLDEKIALNTTQLNTGLNTTYVFQEDPNHPGEYIKFEVLSKDARAVKEGSDGQYGYQFSSQEKVESYYSNGKAVGDGSQLADGSIVYTDGKFYQIKGNEDGSVSLNSLSYRDATDADYNRYESPEVPEEYYQNKAVDLVAGLAAAVNQNKDDVITDIAKFFGTDGKSNVALEQTLRGLADTQIGDTTAGDFLNKVLDTKLSDIGGIGGYVYTHTIGNPDETLGQLTGLTGLEHGTEFNKDFYKDQVKGDYANIKTQEDLDKLQKTIAPALQTVQVYQAINRVSEAQDTTLGVFGQLLTSLAPEGTANTIADSSILTYAIKELLLGGDATLDNGSTQKFWESVDQIQGLQQTIAQAEQSGDIQAANQARQQLQYALEPFGLRTDAAENQAAVHEAVGNIALVVLTAGAGIITREIQAAQDVQKVANIAEQLGSIAEAGGPAQARETQALLNQITTLVRSGAGETPEATELLSQLSRTFGGQSSEATALLEQLSTVVGTDATESASLLSKVLDFAKSNGSDILSDNFFNVYDDMRKGKDPLPGIIQNFVEDFFFEKGLEGAGKLADNITHGDPLSNLGLDLFKSPDIAINPGNIHYADDSVKQKPTDSVYTVDDKTDLLTPNQGRQLSAGNSIPEGPVIDITHDTRVIEAGDHSFHPVGSTSAQGLEGLNLEGLPSSPAEVTFSRVLPEPEPKPAGLDTTITTADGRTINVPDGRGDAFSISRPGQTSSPAPAKPNPDFFIDSDGNPLSGRAGDNVGDGISGHFDGPEPQGNPGRQSTESPSFETGSPPSDDIFSDNTVGRTSKKDTDTIATRDNLPDPTSPSKAAKKGKDTDTVSTRDDLPDPISQSKSTKRGNDTDTVITAEQQVDSASPRSGPEKSAGLGKDTDTIMTQDGSVESPPKAANDRPVAEESPSLVTAKTPQEALASVKEQINTLQKQKDELGQEFRRIVDEKTLQGELPAENEKAFLDEYSTVRKDLEDSLQDLTKQQHKLELSLGLTDTTAGYVSTNHEAKALSDPAKAFSNTAEAEAALQKIQEIKQPSAAIQAYEAELKANLSTPEKMVNPKEALNQVNQKIEAVESLRQKIVDGEPLSAQEQKLAQQFFGAGQDPNLSLNALRDYQEELQVLTGQKDPNKLFPSTVSEGDSAKDFRNLDGSINQDAVLFVVRNLNDLGPNLITPQIAAYKENVELNLLKDAYFERGNYDEIKGQVSKESYEAFEGALKQSQQELGSAEITPELKAQVESRLPTEDLIDLQTQKDRAHQKEQMLDKQIEALNHLKQIKEYEKRLDAIAARDEELKGLQAKREEGSLSASEEQRLKVLESQKARVAAEEQKIKELRDELRPLKAEAAKQEQAIKSQYKAGDYKSLADDFAKSHEAEEQLKYFRASQNILQSRIDANTKQLGSLKKQLNDPTVSPELKEDLRVQVRKLQSEGDNLRQDLSDFQTMEYRMQSDWRNENSLANIQDRLDLKRKENPDLYEKAKALDDLKQKIKPLEVEAQGRARYLKDKSTSQLQEMSNTERRKLNTLMENANTDLQATQLKYFESLSAKEVDSRIKGLTDESVAQNELQKSLNEIEELQDAIAQRKLQKMLDEIKASQPAEPPVTTKPGIASSVSEPNTTAPDLPAPGSQKTNAVTNNENITKDDLPDPVGQQTQAKVEDPNITKDDLPDPVSQKSKTPSLDPDATPIALPDPVTRNTSTRSNQDPKGTQGTTSISKTSTAPFSGNTILSQGSPQSPDLMPGITTLVRPDGSRIQVATPGEMGGFSLNKAIPEINTNFGSGGRAGDDLGLMLDSGSGKKSSLPSTPEQRIQQVLDLEGPFSIERAEAAIETRLNQMQAEQAIQGDNFIPSIEQRKSLIAEMDLTELKLQQLVGLNDPLNIPPNQFISEDAYFNRINDLSDQGKLSDSQVNEAFDLLDRLQEHRGQLPDYVRDPIQKEISLTFDFSLPDSQRENRLKRAFGVSESEPGLAQIEDKLRDGFNARSERIKAAEENGLTYTNTVADENLFVAAREYNALNRPALNREVPLALDSEKSYGSRETEFKKALGLSESDSLAKAEEKVRQGLQDYNERRGTPGYIDSQADQNLFIAARELNDLKRNTPLIQREEALITLDKNLPIEERKQAVYDVLGLKGQDRTLEAAGKELERLSHREADKHSAGNIQNDEVMNLKIPNQFLNLMAVGREVNALQNIPLVEQGKIISFDSSKPFADRMENLAKAFGKELDPAKSRENQLADLQQRITELDRQNRNAATPDPVLEKDILKAYVELGQLIHDPLRAKNMQFDSNLPMGARIQNIADAFDITLDPAKSPRQHIIDLQQAIDKIYKADRKSGSPDPVLERNILKADEELDKLERSTRRQPVPAPTQPPPPAPKPLVSQSPARSIQTFDVTRPEGQALLDQALGDPPTPRELKKLFEGRLENVEIQQQSVGDCFLIASLYGSLKDPDGQSAIEQAIRIKRDSNGEIKAYQVQFKNKDGTVSVVEVEPDSKDIQNTGLFTMVGQAFGKQIGDHKPNYTRVDGPMGIRIIEKAYLEYKDPSGRYLDQTLSKAKGGYGDDALSAITGWPAFYMDAHGNTSNAGYRNAKSFATQKDSQAYNDAKDFLMQMADHPGQSIVTANTPPMYLGGYTARGQQLSQQQATNLMNRDPSFRSYADPQGQFVNQHAYTVLGVTRVSNDYVVEIYNPHGVNYKITIDQFLKIFNSIAGVEKP